ncbi:MAG: hypothetical protein K1X64_08420 [Myxococcaceae bacterium]|nr:hypothetical protein [Myxococcaceae bacterium]
MFRNVRWWVCVALVASSLALAQSKVKEFNGGPAKLSEADVAALKEKARKGNVNDYREAGLKEPAPIPWMAIGLGAIAFIVAIPFAMRSYRDTARELANATAFASPRRSASKSAGDAPQD